MSIDESFARVFAQLESCGIHNMTELEEAIRRIKAPTESKASEICPKCDKPKLSSRWSDYEGGLQTYMIPHFCYCGEAESKAEGTVCVHGIHVMNACGVCGRGTNELQISKSLADKVEDGEVSIESLCDPEPPKPSVQGDDGSWELDGMVRDFCAVGPRPKSEVKRRILEYAAKSAPSITSERIAELANTLYNRFKFRGWKPEDSYALIRSILEGNHAS